MKEITTKQWTCNPFESIGRQWMLITAARDGRVNTMTASWGGMGVLWGSDVVYIFVRQSRFTKEFIDAADTFSLTFYPANERPALAYLGSHSGRDEDKIGKVDFHVAMDGQTPYFKEADTAILCTKLSKHPIRLEDMPDDIRQKWYADGDCHDMYVGRIDKILVKQA